jgi:hypothetical protein
MTTTTGVSSTSTCWAYSLNEWGGPLLPPPPMTPSLTSRVTIFFVKYVVFFFAWPVVMIAFSVNGTKRLSFSVQQDLFRTINYAQQHPINSKEDKRRYQDPQLLSRVYQLPSAQPYLQRGALEWQPREGFCSGTTVRCILKSFSSIPTPLVPSVMTSSGGPRTAEDVCKAFETIGREETLGNNNNIHLETHLLRPDDQTLSYESFLKELQANLQDPNTRVAINYLRSALFGWSLPWYWWPVAPVSLILGLFGGHFSFILGILPPPSLSSSNNTKNDNNDDDDEPLVAIFDVNHKYGGTYLVPAKRLYHAVKAQDATTKLSRALICVTDKSRRKQK